MASRAARFIVAGLLAAPLSAEPAARTSAEPAAKPQKPRLDLRAAPRIAFSPVNVLFTAELAGGDEVEEFYCPEIEWLWDDGGKSVHESDCPPFVEGSSTLERRFTAEHTYGKAGVYNVKATMRRSGKALLAQTVRVTVRAGFGDRTIEEP